MLRAIRRELESLRAIRRMVRDVTYEPDLPQNHWICRLHDTVVEGPQDVATLACCAGKSHCVWWGPGGQVISSFRAPGISSSCE